MSGNSLTQIYSYQGNTIVSLYGEVGNYYTRNIRVEPYFVSHNLTDFIVYQKTTQFTNFTVQQVIGYDFYDTTLASRGTS